MYIVPSSTVDLMFGQGCPFKDASEEEKSFIIQLTKYKEFEPDTKLFEEGKIAPGFYGVLEGKVRLSKLNRKGELNIIRDFSQGEWLGFISCLSTLNSPHDAISIKATKVLYLDRPSVDQIYEKYPHLYKYTLQLISSAFVRLEKHLDNTCNLPLINRISGVLHRLYLLNNKQPLDLSHAELAAYISSTRESVSSGLKKLENEGVISLKYKKIELKNWIYLESIAEGKYL